MDYEAAFLRERKARKNAESILEQKSRELHLANISLQDNVDSLDFALRENQFLVHISRYGIEKPKLLDFLPTIVSDMMRLSKMPFAKYMHYPFDSDNQSYHSPLLHDPNFQKLETLDINTSEIDDLISAIEPIVRDKQKTHFQLVDLIINEKHIDTVIALPINSSNHLSGMIVLFSHALTDKQNQILSIFKTGIKQLAIIMEHRFQEDKLLASYEDISAANNALQEAHKKLIQSEKMATVGQLSAGIAHEINNPMGYIKSNMMSLDDYMVDFTEYINSTKTLTDLTLQSSDENVLRTAKDVTKIWSDLDMVFLLQDSRSLLEESQQGVKRIIDIVGGLKRFSRQSDNIKEQCNVSEIINEALKLAQNELKFKGIVNTNFSDIAPINANSGELLQVFLNLIVNASHAMNDQGELSITLAALNNGVSIKIADNGCGINEEHLKSIFDPFFTTKEIGVGTGLGLSISYGIIQDHQGTIEVSSEIGKGTSFHIWLPYENTSPVNESKRLK